MWPIQRMEPVPLKRNAVTNATMTESRQRHRKYLERLFPNRRYNGLGATANVLLRPN
ncbi:hypothetical protein F01_410125 [Burkholderia cenocepacia]|nr:hypothetical protein F01_410125 [Burkholderia cenocepacia]